MSSGSDQSLDEKMKAYQKRSTEDLDPTDSDDAFEYQLRQIRQEADEVSDSGPFYLTANRTARIGAIIGLFLLGFIGSAIVVSPITGGMATFYGLMVSGGGFLFLTRFGVATRRAFSTIQSNSQQQIGSSSDPKQRCANCGWQNPKQNTYCHDCGEELGTE